MGYCITGQWRV
ncbi:hypothetical protein TIFTF001_056456 [Ficus carica]|uniref:Uncharacterized protein n=1 Tax=Ficus carica TaxID=3494 RepID=A0AA88EIJ0_FICCA|nr:hypothetical protein TIFTF001_056456 [Ficus carica]